MVSVNGDPTDRMTAERAPAGRIRRAVRQARAAVAVARDPFTGYPELYRRFGPVCTLGVGPLRHTCLLGPQANRFLFANSHLFSWREAFQPLVPVDGPTALIVSDGTDHQRRRRAVQPAFHRDRLDGWVATMAANADAVIDAWRPGRRLDLYQEFRRAIRRSTIQVLFGAGLAAEERIVGERLQLAIDLLEANPLVRPVQRALPGYRRAIQARRLVADRVRAEIDARRRTQHTDAPDMLTTLVHSGLSDAEVVDQVISLIAAGYETTSAAMAWAARALMLNADLWRRALTELDLVVDPGRVVSAADLPRLRFLDGVVSETLRLYPPAAISVRRAVGGFTFAGHRIPAGAGIIFSPLVTHRLPELWPDPLRFDPDRWDTDRPDHRKPAPHEYLPFGGGPHRCIGAGLARLELKTMLAQLIRRTSVCLLRPGFEPTSLAAMRPRHGLPVEVQVVDPR